MKKLKSILFLTNIMIIALASYKKQTKDGLHEAFYSLDSSKCDIYTLDGEIVIGSNGLTNHTSP